MENKVDIIVLGGGLAACLAALKLKGRTANPDTEMKVLLIDSENELSRPQTWTFHESDVTPESLDWLKPMISRSWERTTVQFPRIEKTTEGRYHALRSEDLQKLVKEKLGAAVLSTPQVTQATDALVILASGDSYSAELVVDARNLASLPPAKLNGFHKSVAYDVVLEGAHGLQVPIIMDATCPQLDGFRSFALLPWDDNRVIIEESYYSDSPDLNTERISRSIEAFAQRRGWKIASREREVVSCMPMPMTSEYLTNGEAGTPLPIGARGGYFHATTSNLFPDAVRVAEFLSAQTEITTAQVRESAVRFRRPWLSRQRFYRVMNRLLFYASEPSLRYHVLQQLFEQPSDVVARYTSGRTSWGDRLRIITGRPSLPLDRTVKSFSERAILSRG